MKPHESPPPPNKKNQFVAIRAIRGLCGIGVYSTQAPNPTICPNIWIRG